MNEKIQILEAKLWGAIDATLCKGYSLKKAKQFIKVKAEIFMPNIDKGTMKAVLQFTEQKHKFETSLENLKLALFKQRDDIQAISTQLNSCCENNELEEEVEIE